MFGAVAADNPAGVGPSAHTTLLWPCPGQLSGLPVDRAAESTHLASRGGNIAPRARHLGEQLAATATLGKAAVVVAPAGATTLPARPTRHEPCPWLYFKRQCYCRTKYLAIQAANALFAQVSGAGRWCRCHRTAPSAHTTRLWPYRRAQGRAVERATSVQTSNQAYPPS